MRYELGQEECRDFGISSKREWILTNGIGGFAMGTPSGINTRRYHGLFVSAIEPPTKRMVLLSSIECYATVSGQTYGLSANQYSGAVHPQGFQYLTSFHAGDIVKWMYSVGGTTIRKRLQLHRGTNAATIEYTNLGPATAQLSLRPLVCHKFYHENFRVADFYPEFLLFPDDRTILTHQGQKLVIEHAGCQRVPSTGWYYRFENEKEYERGLDPTDDLFCPCELVSVLAPGESVRLVAAQEEGVAPLEFVEKDEPRDIEYLLTKSARKFLVKTKTRCTIIAGYPWFTDWGRDTMISLPGICLATGHLSEAKQILRDYASQMKQGLIPNRFVDHDAEPDYNTVDATLWFANAIYQTLKQDWDKVFARDAIVWLTEVYNWHEKGTFFGIKVDPEDGLLRQGESGAQLTWMDVKIGDWVVTPRHGKPIEINGLWINFLRIMEWLYDQMGHDGLKFRLAAEKAESNFDRKFWRETVGHYLDTADPDDATLRPNQVIAMGLDFSPAKGPNAVKALDAVTEHLLTPRGLRTLDPGSPNFMPRFEGDMEHRDEAYHQGTVWPWLTGSYVAALLKVKGDRLAATQALEHITEMLSEGGFGGIAEVYDATDPQRPDGCPWQAWSTAETLRAINLLKG